MDPSEPVDVQMRDQGHLLNIETISCKEIPNLTRLVLGGDSSRLRIEGHSLLSLCAPSLGIRLLDNLQTYSDHGILVTEAPISVSGGQRPVRHEPW